MGTASANGIELVYETFGDPTDPPLLLVMGLGAQMIAWDTEFCELLAAGGRYVIRFDNRDIGLSTHFDGHDVDMGALMAAMTGAGPSPDVPYLLSDMAADAVGLLDALEIDAAHIVGASMGGMIVQTMAIEHPGRVRSLTSIMSTSGERDYMQSSPEALAVLLTPAPTDRDGYIASAPNAAVISSKRYFDADRAKERAAVAYDRSFYPEGMARQFAAIQASGDRAEGLRSLSTPTLVIHGSDDTLIMPPGGFRTAELVPGADLLMLGDMGHDLPEALWPMVTNAILAHTARADG